MILILIFGKTVLTKNITLTKQLSAHQDDIY